jgi:hypothetical protein
MADAMFLNCTPFEGALNLNGNDTNQPTVAMPSIAPTIPPTLTLPGTIYRISANKSGDTFGASSRNNEIENLLIRFSSASGMPTFWFLKSTVSVALGLFFYMYDDTIVGVDQTGSSAGIATRKATIQEHLTLARRFSSVVNTLAQRP